MWLRCRINLINKVAGGLWIKKKRPVVGRLFIIGEECCINVLLVSVLLLVWQRHLFSVLRLF